MSRRAIVLGLTIALVLSATAAFAATLTVTSKHLAGANLAVPIFYPNNLTTTNAGANTRKPEQNDTLTVVFSAELQESTVCAGAPTTLGTQSINTATVNIANNTGSTGNDVLSMGAISTVICTDGQLKFGSVDLGANSYVTAATTFSNSTFAVTQTATSCTIVIKLGTVSGSPTRAPSGTAAVYTPNTALTDTLGHAIGVSTAITTATTVF